MARRDLPFRLARQMLPGKAGEGIGFVVADVLHRSGRVDGSEAPQRHDMPGAVLLSPIAGCLPVFVLHRCPAVGEPKGRRRVAAGWTTVQNENWQAPGY